MRIAYTMKLRPGMRDAYIESHRAVWPELIEAARGAGIRNHSVFLHGDTLFLYIEADNPASALSDLACRQVKQEWDRYMQEFLFPESEPCTEAFHMD